MTPERSRPLHFAALADQLWTKPPTHAVRCTVCRWCEESPRRKRALRIAAAHVEESGHLVMVTALDIDYLMAVPATERWASRRVLPVAVRRNTEAAS